MFKTIKINKFCDSMLSHINNERPQRIVEFLSAQGVFYEETATLLSLYTFGYCLGALDYYFENLYGLELRTRIRSLLCKKYMIFVEKNLLNPHIDQQRKALLLKEILLKNNMISEFVTFMLKENSDDCYEVLSNHYLETIQVSSFTIKDIDQFESAIKDLVTFSPLPKI